MKPTHLGLDQDPEATLQRLRDLATRSAVLGKHLFLDMEAAPYVEPTLAIYRQLREEFENTGVCIQALPPPHAAGRGGPTRGRRLDPAGEGRLPGAPSGGDPDHRQIRATFEKLALEFLRWGNGGRLALASHDVELLTEIEQRAAAAGFGRDSFEIQMLYGIRVADQRRLAREGYRVPRPDQLRHALVPLVHAAHGRASGTNIWLAVRNCGPHADEPRRLHGAIAAAVTPLKDGGRALDPDSFDPLVGFLAAGGIDGVLACGTTGEGVLLSVDERRHVAEAFLAVRPDGFQIARPRGAQTTRDTVALAAHALEIGAEPSR